MNHDDFLNYQSFPGCTITYKGESLLVLEKDVEEGLFCVRYCGLEKWVRYENAEPGEPRQLTLKPRKKTQRASKHGKPWSFYQ